jgi:hypothetical protein
MTILLPTSAFVSVDFPAFGRPTKLTKPDLKLTRLILAPVTARVPALLIAIALLVAGCTSSGSPSGSSRHPGQIVPTGRPSFQVVGPAGIREVRAHSCQFASATAVRNTMGMRLGRITRLTGTRVSGCRFYALQGSYLHAKEHLPGPEQPVLEIVTHRYASAREAHNAVVLIARSGHNPQRESFGKIEGACFQTNYYPKDHGQDWACAANKRRIEVVIHSVDTTSTINTQSILRAVLHRV